MLQPYFKNHTIDDARADFNAAEVIDSMHRAGDAAFFIVGVPVTTYLPFSIILNARYEIRETLVRGCCSTHKLNMPTLILDTCEKVCTFTMSTEETAELALTMIRSRIAADRKATDPV